MAQNFKPAMTPVTTHNMWKRNWRQRQPDQKSHGMSQVLTITSVNPLVMKGNACSVKQNPKPVGNESTFPKCVQKSPRGLSHLEEYASTNKTQQNFQNLSSGLNSNKIVSKLQIEDISQLSNKLDSRTSHQNHHAVSRSSNPCDSTPVDQSNFTVGLSTKVKPNTPAPGFLKQCPVQTKKHQALLSAHPSGLRCAGFKVLALHRMMHHDQRARKTKESSAATSEVISTENNASDANPPITVTIKNAAGIRISDTVPSKAVSLGHTDISIQGNSALRAKNQQTIMSKSDVFKRDQMSTNANLPDSDGKENDPENTSKCQAVSQYPYALPTNCLNTNKHWTNPADSTQTRLDKHGNRNGQYLKFYSSITSCAGNPTKLSETPVTHSDANIVASDFPDTKQTSTLANARTTMVSTSDDKPDKENHSIVVRNNVPNHEVLPKRNMLENSRADRPSLEKTVPTHSSEPTGVKTAGGSADYARKHTVLVNEMDTDKQPGQENRDMSPGFRLESNDTVASSVNNRQTSVDPLTTRNTPVKEVKPIHTDQVKSESVLTKFTDSTNVSRNHGKNVSVNLSETNQLPLNAVNNKSSPEEPNDTENTTIISTASSLSVNTENSSGNTTSKHNNFSHVAPRGKSTNVIETQLEAVNVVDNSCTPELLSKDKLTPDSPSDDTKRNPRRFVDYKCKSKQSVSAENVASNENDTELISKDMSVRQSLQSKYHYPDVEKMSDTATAENTSADFVNANDPSDQENNLRNNTNKQNKQEELMKVDDNKEVRTKRVEMQMENRSIPKETEPAENTLTKEHSENTLPKGQVENIPPKEQAENTPAKGQVENTPAMGHVENTPAMGQIENTPAKGQVENTPAKGQVENTPAKGQIENTPAKGQVENTPAKGQVENTPAKGQVENTPAKGQVENTPAKGQVENTPAKGQVENTPAKGQVENTPAKGQVENTPAKGQAENTPAKGRVENTLAKGQVENTPVKGQLENTPAMGQVENTPTKERTENSSIKKHVEKPPTKASNFLAIVDGSSSRLSKSVGIQRTSQDPINTKDVTTDPDDTKKDPAISADLKNTPAQVPEAQPSTSSQIPPCNVQRKASGSAVKTGLLNHSQIHKTSLNINVESSLECPKDGLCSNVKDDNSANQSVESDVPKPMEDASDSSVETASVSEEPDCVETQHNRWDQHQDVKADPENTSPDIEMFEKIPTEEISNMADCGNCDDLKDCSGTSKVSKSGTETKDENKTGEQSRNNTRDGHPSPAMGDSQQSKPVRTVPLKAKSTAVKHSQDTKRAEGSQYSVSKQTVSVYSQRLPRRTRGKSLSAVTPKEETSQKTAAATWSRVQSAQPQVFRSVARVAVRVSQQRSKSVMDMAGNKEPAPRCHCHRRLPGSEVSCQCGQETESETEVSTDLERQVKWFSMLWDQCVSSQTVDKARDVLKQMSVTQRQQLVEKVDDRDQCTVLASCCKMGHLHMVEFLLDQCGVDVDRRTVYQDTQSLTAPSVHKNVTALWCAAVEGQVEVVKTLIRHGADIHAKSVNGSSAIRSACYRLQVEVVEVLLKAGADVHSPNVDGVTCLMNGCNSPEMCHLLLRHGARPNDSDVTGNTALHYAATVGQLQSLRLLLQFGGKVLEKNHAGSSVLRCAALRGWLHIVGYLSHCCSSVGIAEVIEAYELAGSTLVDLNDNDQFYEEGITAWQKAMHLRHISAIPKTRLRQERIPAFQHRLEFTTQKQLDRIAVDRDEVRIHALLVKERICGATSEELIRAVISRGTLYQEAGVYRPCIDLWLYAFRILFQSAGGLKRSLHHFLHKMVKLFLELNDQRVKDSEEVDVLQVSDTLEMLQLLVHYLNHAVKQLQQQQQQQPSTSSPQNQGAASNIKQDPNQHSSDQDFEKYFLHLGMSLHLIRLISTFQKLLPDEQQRLHELTYQLVKGGHRSPKGENVLHLCFPLCEVEGGKNEYRVPTVQTLQTLIQCGAHVDAVNLKGESPLFYVFSPPHSGHGVSTFEEAGIKFNAKEPLWGCMEDLTDKESWANVLLKKGAHADRRSLDRGGVLKFLKRMDSFCPVRHVSLQCLAARAIRDHRVFYRDPETFPSHLISFVDIH